jgi:deoxyhypusine synthase
MQRDYYLRNPVEHMCIRGKLSVDGLVYQFRRSGSFGAGRLATACDIYERMVREPDCTIFLGLSGAVIPAGMRQVIVDLIRNHFIDVVVCTGASMVHDAIEAIGGRHYKGSWMVDDAELYKYHIFRIYDVLVPEEAFVRLDQKLAAIYDEIASEKNGRSLSSREFAWEIGKRLDDPNSILRAAYEEDVPIFIPALRDSEFGFIHWLHSDVETKKNVLKVDAFSDVPEICRVCIKSPKNGMIVIGGGVPRNTIQSAALASKKGLDYAVVVTMDRPETGGLSGSTLKETKSWGKTKTDADDIMVIGDALIIFPLMVASLTERLGQGFKRSPFLIRTKSFNSETR